MTTMLQHEGNDQRNDCTRSTRVSLTLDDDRRLGPAVAADGVPDDRKDGKEILRINWYG